MSHFTYRCSNDTNYKTLSQGDIIEKNNEILDIIKEVHPHYQKEDYKYFLVLTQSCDLVRRDGSLCKAPYISLSAIRPFDTLVKRVLSKYQSTDLERKGMLCSTAKKTLLLQFLERILNNNEQEYFYLEKDDDFGFHEPMVAFLRLSIAIKSDYHYETCLKAKRMELVDGFTAKLGWLLGQMYSRVGTIDWVPDNLSKKEFDEKCNEVLDSCVIWLEDKVIRELIKTRGKDELTKEEIREFAGSISIAKKKEIVEKQLFKIIEIGNFLDGMDAKKLVNRIINDSIISNALK